MPWIDAEFSAVANEDGEFDEQQKLVAPIGGHISAYKLETSIGCEGRIHPTRLIIQREDDSEDKLVVGPINLQDCTKYEGAISPRFRVRSGKTYVLALKSGGFKNLETIDGTAAVKYGFFLDFTPV